MIGFGPVLMFFLAIFISPSSPWENGYIESFINKLRDECLNREVFRY